jgi:SAM-dependent methyltransferase
MPESGPASGPPGTSASRTSFRDRVYGHYVSAGQAQAPITAEGLRSRAPFIEAMIERHFPEDRDGAIIDLGCGGGAVLWFAQRAGYRNARGVDVSAEQVAAAQRLGVEGVRQGGLLETLHALGTASQAAVLSLDVLEHLTRDELLPVLDEVHRVLAPAGRWIINVPNAESPLFGRVRYGDPTHELAFTRESLTTLLLASGFRSVACFENAPLARGPIGVARWLIWKLIRGVLRVWLAAESGDSGRRAVFTQNMMAVALK